MTRRPRRRRKPGVRSASRSGGCNFEDDVHGPPERRPGQQYPDGAAGACATVEAIGQRRPACRHPLPLSPLLASARRCYAVTRSCPSPGTCIRRCRGCESGGCHSRPLAWGERLTRRPRPPLPRPQSRPATRPIWWTGREPQIRDRCPNRADRRFARLSRRDESHPSGEIRRPASGQFRRGRSSSSRRVTPRCCASRPRANVRPPASKPRY